MYGIILFAGMVLTSCGVAATSVVAQLEQKGADPAASPAGAIEYIGPFPVTQRPGDSNQGWIQDWVVLGPFPNPSGPGEKKDSAGWDTDFLVKQGGESNVTPVLNMPVEIRFDDSIYWDAGSVTQQWSYRYTWQDKLQLNDLDCRPLGIYYPQCVSAYAACSVYSKSERKVKLAIGAQDDYKVWLNHVYVGGTRRFGEIKTDEFVYDVILKAGMNSLLVKCGKEKDGWEFCLRFLDGQVPIANDPKDAIGIYIPVKEKKAVMTMIPKKDPEQALKQAAAGQGEWLTNSMYDGHFLGADMIQHPDVPQGKVVTNFNWVSQVFPETTRRCWIYVPAQYTPSNPASLMLFLDGNFWVDRQGALRAFAVPTLMDNLIHKGEVPVTICLLVSAGSMVNGALPKYHLPFNRHVEYDTISDKFSRMLLEEILPLVRKNYNLSKDPKDWAIGGVSSGATAATLVAFYHPEVFGKLWIPIASPQDIYGEGQLFSLFYERPIKPLRIYLGSGTEDFCLIYVMRQALATYSAGYDCRFVVTPSSHRVFRGENQFPDSLRWLWRKP